MLVMVLVCSQSGHVCHSLPKLLSDMRYIKTKLITSTDILNCKHVYVLMCMCPCVIMYVLAAGATDCKSNPAVWASLAMTAITRCLLLLLQSNQFSA